MTTRAAAGNARARQTRQRLQEALAELTTTRSFEAVTVEALSAQADVHRATFYRHFRDKENLALSPFEDALERLAARLLPGPGGTQGRRSDDPAAAWVQLFEEVASRAPLYRALLLGPSAPWFAAALRTRLAAVLRPPQSPSGRTDGMPPDAAAALRSSAVLATVVWWLETGLATPPAQLAQWVLPMVLHRWPRPATVPAARPAAAGRVRPRVAVTA